MLRMHVTNRILPRDERDLRVRPVLLSLRPMWLVITGVQDYEMTSRRERRQMRMRIRGKGSVTVTVTSYLVSIWS